MITINIPARAVALAGVLAAALLALFASDALGSGDTPDQVIQGDINCDNVVDHLDALGALQHTAGLEVDQQDPCFAPGSVAAIPGPPGPAGITQFASVTFEGVLLGGTATTATRQSAGLYQVTFPIADVTPCSPIVTSGSVDGGFATYAYVRTQLGSPVPDNQVRVTFEDDAGADVDTGFHLILVC